MLNFNSFPASPCQTSTPCIQEYQYLSFVSTKIKLKYLTRINLHNLLEKYYLHFVRSDNNIVDAIMSAILKSLKLVHRIKGAPFSVSLQRMASTRMETLSPSKAAAAMQNFDPNNYHIPARPLTMDDLMEPYGSWKTAYEAEKKNANFIVLRGILCFAATIIIFLNSGITEGLYMPNLDNIMEETEGCNFDKEGRKTV